MTKDQRSSAQPASKTIAIAQPTFLPWLGWLDLADQVDMLILLDDVAFSKQSWQQRNRIRTPNGLQFLSVPVRTSGRMGQRISECELVDQAFVVKMIKSLRISYAKAPFFATVIDDLTSTFEAAACTNRLVELNCALISWIANKLEVSTPMIRSSTLAAGGERGEHVAALCERVGADQYVSPAGSEEYLIEDKAAFGRRDISIMMHVYDHPVYVQCFAPFMPYASALDLIFNAGPQAPAVMRSGRRPTRPLGAGPLIQKLQVLA